MKSALKYYVSYSWILTCVLCCAFSAASAQDRGRDERPEEVRTDAPRSEERRDERSREERRDERREERSRDERFNGPPPGDERFRDDRYRDPRGYDERYSRDPRGYGYGDERDPGREYPPPGTESGTTPAKPVLLVPGFGVGPNGQPLVPGFDVPLTSTSERPVEQVYDPRAIERAQRTMRDNDHNHNNLLEGEEIESGKFTNPPFADSDLNKDGKLSIYELCNRYAKRYGWYDIPGTIRSSAGGSEQRGGGGTAGGGDDKVRSYAESLLKQYDENKDGMLQKDEWSKMKSDYHSADQNGDHVITLDEIHAKLITISGPGAASASPSTSSGKSYSGRSTSGYSRDGSRGSSGKSEPPKFPRFLTATERLPKGLPDWFLRNDADGDGQILMSEYAAAWNDATAAEFMKYDLNKDGFITPGECLDALEAQKKPSSTTSTSSGDKSSSSDKGFSGKR